MFEDLLKNIEEIQEKDIVFKESIKKLAKEDKIRVCSDHRYSNKVFPFKSSTTFENYPDDIKQGIENNATYLEYIPRVFSKTNKLLEKSKVSKTWKVIPGEENSEISIFHERITFYKLSFKESSSFGFGYTYTQNSGATNLKLRKFENKPMLFLLNKNGFFNIFEIDEPRISSLTEEESDTSDNINSKIKEYNSGISSKFFPLNTALFIEGVLNSTNVAFKEKLRQTAEASPSSTFSCIYNFVIKQKEPLNKKILSIFEQMSSSLSGKYFNVSKGENSIEICANFLRYFNLNRELGSNYSSLAFGVKTKYKRDLVEHYIFSTSNENSMEFTKEKINMTNDELGLIYYSIFPKSIILDTKLGIGVKFEEDYIYDETTLMKYCKNNKYTNAYTRAIFNIFRNINTGLAKKVYDSNCSLSEVENLIEYVNLFIKSCEKIESLNIEPIGSTYLIDCI